MDAETASLMETMCIQRAFTFSTLLSQCNAKLRGTLILKPIRPDSFLQTPSHLCSIPAELAGACPVSLHGGLQLNISCFVFDDVVDCMGPPRLN